MKRYLPTLAAFLAAICLISAPFVGALAEENDAAPTVIARRPQADAAIPDSGSPREIAAAIPDSGSSGEIAAAGLRTGLAMTTEADAGLAMTTEADAGLAMTTEETAAPAPADLQTSASAGISVSARSAIVLDAEAGAVLYEKDADREALIASTTKIMTAIVVLEHCDPDAEYEIPPEATNIEGSSIYLQAGERLTIRDLLYGMMLHSGNDAAAAIALIVDGEEALFVERMNREAAELGLSHTRFANPHGLDSEDNYSTARDLARLTAAALKDPAFAAAVSTRQIEAAGRTLTNHNRLLWTCEGCVGVKTGYTKAAGRTLVSAARRGGRLLICVTLDDPDDWADHCRLLDAAFSRYHETPAAAAGEEVLRLRLGAADGLPLVARESLSVLLLPGEELSYAFLPLTGEADAGAPLYSPGAAAGAVEIRVDGRPAGTVSVTWGERIQN